MYNHIMLKTLPQLTEYWQKEQGCSIWDGSKHWEATPADLMNPLLQPVCWSDKMPGHLWLPASTWSPCHLVVHASWRPPPEQATEWLHTSRPLMGVPKMEEAGTVAHPPFPPKSQYPNGQRAGVNLWLPPSNTSKPIANPKGYAVSLAMRYPCPTVRDTAIPLK